MKRIILAILSSLLIFTHLISQTLEGRVVDRDGTPLMDAYIFKNGGQVHVHTNDLGMFECQGLTVGDTLNVTYLGYESKKLRLEKKDFEKPIKIELQEKYFDLAQVVVSNDVRSVSQVSKIDLLANPVNSSQEILRKVPGLFIGQHAGGGKAEQLFLRGFDIDHGTDVSISVDGMPVNMVSHAHGQGYADLHFLIPETIERLDFGKGPYYADKGNFTTAGYVQFETKEKLDNSQVSIEAGQFNTLRTVGLFDLLGNNENQHAYIATEYLLTDGPFDSPQNFNRFNLMGKYTLSMANNDKLSVLASHFTSQWDASGQVPQRAVDAGLIGRFGAIDDTEGGATSRSNLALSHTKAISKNTFVKSRAYYSKYNFELYSNFTFFLIDSLNGDQIRQREDRQLYGLESVLHRQFRPEQFDFNLQAGIGFRYDDVKNDELSRTLNRRTVLENIKLGDVNETNIYGFVNTEFDFGEFVINPGIRLDHFRFHYADALAPTYSTQSVDKNFISPKLNFIYNPSHKVQLFLKTGIGFHSNDTRVVVEQNGRETLPAAYGADLGGVWKPFRRLWVSGALWYLYLQQEFVYVGDAGVVEPSGKTRRMGVDLGLRYQLTDWLFFDTDVNYAYARAIGEDVEDGADYIPLAPDLTATGGLAVKHPSGFTGGLRYRYLKSRPANEDNSITAKGYFVMDANVNYTFKKLTLGVMVENLLNTDWNETQFATESRLFNEPAPVEEIHFTPGTPFFFKGKVTYSF
ncbi:MAG: TonB-dependent receptor plug domain-containing protein [Lewinellaceae bacterium]|nr:TonB-dependent receptor plug domain-containing protein [Saprospiraceae bacterium]MCB9339927.1 TonB-dependent receptor plug domain-containing protein [Lewinellaceae bacterium]